MKTKAHARRILRETYANSKSKLSLFATSFLVIEFIYATARLFIRGSAFLRVGRNRRQSKYAET